MAESLETLLHLFELDGLLAAGDDGAVLERLALLGFVADKLALLTDELGLVANVCVFGLLDLVL